MSSSFRPNIILVHAESMDGRQMGCMGSKAMRSATPHMDQLAESGILFSNAYSTCPVCNPSRASMLSGRYPHAHQCWNNHEGLSKDVPTFLTRMGEAGYAIKTLGGLDYLHGQHSIRDRVGSWTRAANIARPQVRTPLPRIVQDNEDPWEKDWNKVYQGIDWLQGASQKNRPFMLYLTTGLVHPGYVVQEKYLSRVDQDAIAIPPPGTTDHPVAQYQRVAKNAVNEPPEELVKQVRQVYLAMIATLDDMLGQLLTAVDRMGLRDSTYVIFISDHGDMAMEHGQVLKRTMYEPSIRVPFMMSGPGITPGQVVSAPVSLIDVFPTLMEMAGIEAPDKLDGESLLPAALEQKQPQRAWAFAEYHGDRCNTGTFMLKQGPWKYIKFVGYRPQLFNVEDDPWEIHDLAAARPDVVTRMDELLADIVDCEAVDAEAKAYDRAAFVKWRREQQEAGTYAMNMARIFSGFDHLRLDDLQAWCEEDEALIQNWLGE